MRLLAFEGQLWRPLASSFSRADKLPPSHIFAPTWIQRIATQRWQQIFCNRVKRFNRYLFKKSLSWQHIVSQSPDAIGASEQQEGSPHQLTGSALPCGRFPRQGRRVVARRSPEDLQSGFRLQRWPSGPVFERCGKLVWRNTPKMTRIRYESLTERPPSHWANLHGSGNSLITKLHSCNPLILDNRR